MKSGNHDFTWLVKQVATCLKMQPDDVIAPGRYHLVVKARSVLCYWMPPNFFKMLCRFFVDNLLTCCNTGIYAL